MSLPPRDIPLGAMRFNSDSQKLEYWNGSAWFQIQTFSPNLDGGVRGFAAGGAGGPSGPGYKDTVDFYTISTQGNAQDFGDIIHGVLRASRCSSSSRKNCTSTTIKIW